MKSLAKEGELYATPRFPPTDEVDEVLTVAALVEVAGAASTGAATFEEAAAVAIGVLEAAITAVLV